MELLLRNLFLAHLLLLGVASALPLGEERQDNGAAAEVIKVSDPISPIITDPLETPSLEPRSNSTADSSASAQPPTPVPDSQPVTTEQLPPNSPSLVPSVVEISTQDPQNTPPPPANATSTPQPAEEDEESDEEDSEEDEEGGGEEDEDEDEEEDDGDEEEEDNDDVNVIGEKKRSGSRARREVVGNEEISGSFKEHKVQLGSVVVVDEDKVSDEEEAVAAGPASPKEQIKINKNLEKLAVGGSSALQGVPARSPTNEDDEVEAGGSSGGSSVVLGKGVAGGS